MYVALSLCKDTSVVFPPSQATGVEVNEEMFAVLLGVAFKIRNYSFMMYLMKVRVGHAVITNASTAYFNSMTVTVLAV